MSTVSAFALARAFFEPILNTACSFPRSPFKTFSYGSSFLVRSRSFGTTLIYKVKDNLVNAVTCFYKTPNLKKKK